MTNETRSAPDLNLMGHFPTHHAISARLQHYREALWLLAFLVSLCWIISQRKHATTTPTTRSEQEREFRKKVEAWRKELPTPHWGHLRFLGKLRTLILSYTVGIVAILPDLLGTGSLTESINRLPLAWPIVIFVVSIGLAYLSYEYFCPSIIQRFDRLPDFYQHQLNIKKLQMETYPEDPFRADLEHVTEQYINMQGAQPAARYLTLFFYVIGFCSLLYIIIALLLEQWFRL